MSSNTSPGDLPKTRGASEASAPALTIAQAQSEPAEASMEASSSTAAIRVFNPIEAATTISTPSEVDEAFFEPTLSDVQAHHASVLARSKRLNEAPLLTAKYREEEKEGREKRKAERWPETTIRVKFSDGTQIQNTFPSSSPIQPVYAFVRSCLDTSDSSKPFTLWQPPRYTYPEHPPPPLPGTKPKLKSNTTSRGPQIVTAANYGPVRGSAMPGLISGTGGKETLGELGLVPQSVVMIKWEEEGMNATGYPAPLLPELRQKAEPLPSATANREEQQKDKTDPGKVAGEQAKEKKIPKWLQKGLMKKK